VERAVSFASPLVLLALLVLPLLVVLYLGAQRTRRAAAAAFAAPALQPAVAPHRPGWRRHAPMLVFLLALIVLIFAAARPQRTHAVPIERASIMLATDVSGSMLANDVQPNRLIAAKRAARQFVSEVPARINIGVMAFNNHASVLQSPTRNRDEIAAAIDRMAVSGGTATGEAIATATQVLQRVPGENGKRPPAAIVLISDGSSDFGRDPVTAAQEAGRLKIPIYTVALGTDHGTITVPRAGDAPGTVTRTVPPDPQALAQIAHASGGETFAAGSASGLRAVYERLGSQLGHRNEQQQVTAAFAGGAIVLLLLGAGLSTRFFGRLV
jgi:Ca-activated chloride channel family protein